MIFDRKNRVYSLIEVSRSYTIMECLKTGDRITIANSQFKTAGFKANRDQCDEPSNDNFQEHGLSLMAGVFALTDLCQA